MPNFKYLFSLIFLLILTPDIFADTPIFSDNFDKGLSSKYRTLKAKGGFTPKVVNKRLRLTNRKHDLSTAVTLDWEFPTKNNKFTLEFDYYAYGGCEDGNDYNDKSAGKWGADGLSIILFDSSVGMNPTVGASGGSLGYADGYIEMVDGSHEYQFGFQKAWLGIGLDEFGSFTVNDEGRKDINGHTDSKNDLQHNEKPNSVGIRGSTNSGYRLLAYKKNISPRLARYIYKKSDSQKKKLYKSGKYRLTVDSTKDNHLYIELKRYKDKWYTLIDSFDAMASKYHQGTKPKNFRLAFSSGTGGGCNYHEIDNLKIYGNGWEYGTPKITISDADITEGDSGEKEITFNITSDIAIPSGKTVTFDYETIDTGSATSGVDFTYKNSSVTMNAGDTSATVKIKIKGDTDVEGDETFKIKLTNPTNATFADDEATGTIKDDDSANTTGICYALPDNKQKLITFYPNPGASPLPTPQSISLSKEFNGEGSAYRATDGKVYAFKSDNDSDSDPSDLYQIDPNNGSVTKIKSELLPYSVEGAEFYIDPSSGEETFYVIAKEYHSKLYAFDPNDNWSIKSGYPKSITGDTTSIDSIAINPSTGEAYGTDDYDYDSDTPELYRIDLSTGHTTYLTDTASIVDAEGLAYAADGNLYIENELSSNHRIYKINPSTGALTEAVNYDSVSGDFEAISCNGGDINLIATIEDANITEGNSGTKTMNFTVQLNRSVPSGESVSFHYATSDITATAGSDYFAKSGNLNISSGNDSATISITVKGDTDLEDNETFAVTLSNPTNVVIPDSKAIGTIIDDDKKNTDRPFTCEGAFPGPLNSTDISLDILSAEIYGTTDHKLVAPSIKQGTQNDVLCDGEECSWTGTKASTIDFNVNENLGNGTTNLQNDITIDGRTDNEQEYNRIYGLSGKTVNLYGDLTLRVKDEFSYNSSCTINVKYGTVIIYTDKFEFDSGTTLNIDQNSRLIIIANTFDFNSGTGNNYNSPNQFIVLAKDKLEIDSGGTLKGLFYSADKLNVRSGGEYVGSFTGADVDFNSNNIINYDFSAVNDYCESNNNLSSHSISGTIYEDVLGDHQNMQPVDNAKVKLFQDNGNGYLDSQDTFITFKKTANGGKYDFSIQNSGTYFVSVVANTISPSSGFNSGYTIDDVWAEQTYAPKGGFCADGSGGTYTRTDAGSCYGGNRGTLSDDYSNFGKIEHVAKVEITDQNVTDVNFGFSFNVVTNINDSSNLQGSFRQFIKNANAISGANHMRFVPSVAKNASSSWWSVFLNSSLPTIKDNYTIIDGTAYSLNDGTTVRDDNSGSIGGEGGGVGKVGTGNDGVEDSGDETLLPSFNKPEFEINANDKFASAGGNGVTKGVLVIKSSNNNIKNIALYNAAKNNNENDDKSPAVLIASGDNNKVEQNFIGPRANGNDPGAGNRVNNAVYHKSNYALITKNYIAHIHYTGIWASSHCDITYNYLYYPAYEPYGDGITYEDSNGDTITIKKNRIEYAEAYGIEGWGADSSVLIENNTIRANGQGNSNPANGGENGGIRIYGNNNIVRYNIIKDHPGAGVVIASGKGNLISKNSFYNNQGLSIDIDQTHSSGNINGDGVNPNNGTTSLSKPNKGMDYPVITSTSMMEEGGLHIEGYVGKSTQKISGTHTIEIYKAEDDGNSNGEVEEGDGTLVPHGKGKWYIGTCQSSSNGTFSCNLSVPQGVSYHNGDLLTATATDTNNNTSEYGCMKDEKISVSISDANITEGNDKEKNLNFTVTLSEEPGEEGVSFKYETQDITAKTSDKDYEAASSKTITLEGSTTSYTVSILIYGDTKVEDDETFKVILSDISSNAVFSDSEATGTIINDDMNLSASLKAEYRFDECSYNSTANEVKDTSSNSYDGIGYEMSTSSLAKLGRSADFGANGTDDYISLDYNALNGIEDFTISVWIKTSNTGNQAIVSGTKNNSNYESILMWLSNSTTFSPIILNDQSKSITIPDIADDNWHQLVWTREGAQNCIYIDGNQSGCVNMPTGAVTLVENGLVLGQDQDTINGGFNSSQDFEGKMDELKIFDKALNTTQIQTIYNYEKDGKDYQSGEARGAMECQTPFTCDNTMYISSSIKRGSGEPDGSKIWFHSIDTSTTPFSFNLIGNYYNKTYNAIGYNPKDNFIYGLYGRELLKIDSNGTVDSLGNVQGLPSYQLYSGTFDKNGYYYVGGKYNEDDPNIYKIDISQRKVIQTITMSEHMIVYDFAFSKEGNYLYAIPPNGKFSKISIPDGNVTHIGQNHINYSFDAVFVDNEGRVFANDSYGGGFFEFDPNTGEKFFLSSSQRAQLNDGTNCPNASFIFTDFSDAPSNYGIAKHYILHNTKIGTKTDHDPSSYFSDDALGDDSHGEDDEDGIKVNGVELNAQHLYKNNTYDIQASVTGGGYLSGWIDFNRDGDFEDSGEKILSDKNISSKTIDFNITIPSLATSGESYARFRFSTEPNLSPSGTAIDGEVEDYLIYIEQNDYNITISDANVTEGDEGEDKTISFTVSLSNFAPSSSGGIKVDYATANDTATAGSDYDAKSGTLTFQNNIKDINLTVTVHGNNIPEGDKRFFINLTNARTVNSTTIPVEIEDSQGVGTIINDDSGSFDAIDSYNGSYQSAKGLKTKIVNKPFTLDVVYLPTGNSVGNFYTTNPLIPSMPILLFLQEGTKSTILKDASGTPITATMLPGYNHATTNTGIKIDRAIRNAKIKMKYIDLYYLYNQIMDSCLINSSNNGNIQAMPQCVNSSNKYKNAFGQNAYNRCIVNNGQPCTPSKHGVGNPPYDHIYGCYECTADALGNAVISSDNFAVRADKFQIDLSSATPIKAKENFTISFAALTADATPLSAADYNETNGTSFMIDYNETKASCLKGSLSFASALKFSDGNLSISSNYNEAGSIKVEIKEIDGSEFALVDSDDTNSSLRKITAASKTISFIPDHFDVSWSLSQEGRSFTYYSNQLTNMGAKLSLSVKAKNKANTITKNYDKNCYAKNTNLNITFDIDSEESSPLSLQYSDKNLSGVIIPAGSFNAPSLNNNFTTTLKDSNFTQGIADKIYKISFQKNNATVLEPSSLEIKEINATDSDNVSGKKVLSNQKTIFYYGRINTVNSIEGINPINTKIYYEVYCKDCNKTKYHIDGNTSIDTLNWYQNIYHNNTSCGQIINTVSLDGSTAITVNPSFDHGTQDINLTNPNAPFLDKIRLTPSGWLQYNAINPSIPYIDFTAKFLNPNTNWAGEGKLGHTVDEKISVRRSKKIDW